MARVKRGKQDGDNAILRAVSGCDDIEGSGLHIASRLNTHQDTSVEDRYTVSSVYDGTDFAKLSREERELTRKTRNEYINEFIWERAVKGTVRIYSSLWSVAIVEEGGATYKIGGADLEFNEALPKEPIEIDGDLMVERNGRVAGFALIGAHGKLVRRIKSSKKIWCAKLVPIEVVAKVIKL